MLKKHLLQIKNRDFYSFFIKKSNNLYFDHSHHIKYNNLSIHTIKFSKKWPYTLLIFCLKILHLKMWNNILCFTRPWRPPWSPSQQLFLERGLLALRLKSLREHYKRLCKMGLVQSITRTLCSTALFGRR